MSFDAWFCITDIKIGTFYINRQQNQSYFQRMNYIFICYYNPSPFNISSWHLMNVLPPPFEYNSMWKYNLNKFNDYIKPTICNICATRRLCVEDIATNTLWHINILILAYFVCRPHRSGEPSESPIKHNHIIILWMQTLFPSYDDLLFKSVCFTDQVIHCNF